MNRIILTFLLLFGISYSAKAQTDLDSLYKSRWSDYGFNNTSTTGFFRYVDERVPPDSMRFRTGLGDHGWFFVSYKIGGGGSDLDFIVGAYPVSPYLMSRIRIFTDRMHTQIYDVCLYHGIPYFEWAYITSWVADRSYAAARIETHDNGKLHGRFLVKTYVKYFIDENGQRVEPTNTSKVLYETTFDHGTGYYLDVFPDGARRREGQLRNGIMDGEWIFYARRREIDAAIDEVMEREMNRTKQEGLNAVETKVRAWSHIKTGLRYTLRYVSKATADQIITGQITDFYKVREDRQPGCIPILFKIVFNSIRGMIFILQMLFL